MSSSGSRRRRSGLTAVAFALGIVLLAAAPARAAETVHRVSFGAGADAVGFVVIGSNVALQDGVCRQRVTVRVLVNDEVAGAIPNVEISASNCRLLAHGPALLFLGLTTNINLEAQGERFGLTFDHLPPGPSRVDLDRLHPSVRTRIGSYLAETVGANANSIGAVPPPVSDRRLRRLMIRTGTLDRVPGNMGQRPIDVGFVGVIPPTADTAPRAVFAVFAPPAAFNSGTARFSAEGNSVGSQSGPGDVFQGETVAQPPPTNDLPPPGDVLDVGDTAPPFAKRADRQFIAVPVPTELPSGPYRLTLTIRFTDGTTGTDVETFNPNPPKVVQWSPVGTFPVAGLRILFDTPVASATFTADDVSLVGPDQAPIAVTVSADPSSQEAFAIAFPALTATGTYRVTIGPDIVSTAGVAMTAEFTAQFGVSANPKIVSAALIGPHPPSGLRIGFDRAISPATFTPDDVTSFVGPGGPVAVAAVTVVSGTASRQFDLTFPPQTTVGHYSLSVGPDILDTSGHPMAAVVTVEFFVTPPAPIQTFASSDTPRPIVDNGTTWSSITIDQDIPIEDLNVAVNLTHTWDSDLVLTLISPTGAAATLSNRRGGSGDNYSNTLFDDEAAASIASGAAPFAASYRPEFPLSTFDNQNARGEWRLRVDDAAAQDVGTLLSWSLTIKSP